MISTEHHNLRASLLMVAAMACFALEDVLIKQLATGMPTGQVIMLIGAGGGVVFGLLAWLSGRSLLSRALLLRPVLLRNLSEAVGSVMFILALVCTTLSAASAILQATPLAVTLGAALFLGESVGWRRWTAIGIGFIGVLLIIQPGLAGFTPASLFAVAAVFLLAAAGNADILLDREKSAALEQHLGDDWLTYRYLRIREALHRERRTGIADPVTQRLMAVVGSSRSRDIRAARDGAGTEERRRQRGIADNELLVTRIEALGKGMRSIAVWVLAALAVIAAVFWLR